MVRIPVVVSLALLVAVLATGCAAAPPRSGASPVAPQVAADAAAAGASGAQQPSLPAVLPPRPADLVPVVKELARLNTDNVAVSKVEDIKTAQDSQGAWWVSARITPGTSSGDSASIYLVSEQERWVVRYLGDDVGQAGLPADVRDKL